MHRAQTYAANYKPIIKGQNNMALHIQNKERFKSCMWCTAVS